MFPHDWLDWSNAGVGVGGLVLTLGAVWQAAGAKKAASEARDAAYRRNTSDDLRRLDRLASSLLTAIQTEAYGLASHQARDFISECLYIREHHRARLGHDGGKLDQAFVLIRDISRGLQGGPDSGNLVDWAERLVASVSSLAGVLSRDIE